VRTLELADQGRHIVDRAAALQAVRDGLVNTHHRYRSTRSTHRAERRKHVGIGTAGEQGEREEIPVQHVICAPHRGGVGASSSLRRGVWPDRCATDCDVQFHQTQ